jgi:hypothetical protein
MKKRGFIALMVILTVSAIALVISSTIILRSVTEATVSIDEESANKAWAIVNACAEKALYNLASTTGDGVAVWNAYDGAEEVLIDDYSCYILSIDNSGGASTERIVNASSTVNNFTRKVSITVATNTPSLDVESWEMVADFD